MINIKWTRQVLKTNWRTASHVVEVFKVPGVDELLQVIQLCFGGLSPVTRDAARIGV